MGEMCYAVECFNKHLRFTHSQIQAEVWAEKYKSEVYLAFNVPSKLIESKTKNTEETRADSFLRTYFTKREKK